jgi:hypothetical protein
VSEPSQQGYVFDLNAPHPNVDIDTMRRAVVEALANIQQNTDGVDDSYFLADLLFSLLDTALATVDQLTARVALLEAPAEDPPPAEPPPEEPLP